MKNLLIVLTLLSTTISFASAELSKTDINDNLLLDAACKFECSLGSFSGKTGSYFQKRDVQYRDFRGLTLKEIESKKDLACSRLIEQADEEGRFTLSRDEERMTCKYFKH
ncbi:hypothetical protein HBN50_10185 [Halobacteriovorax sp. GB3]|uniref:hypothetical protein n=1 Tax=Halobacteriovorax sp. GB3 TaxID=2719615 RepID=UPI002360DF47|nr:hypothetical protein [Halobacteriovorax sp. GB3]MDD0853469.1 hypothetical protein [Halobacteriovorax sp. GB3]